MTLERGSLTGARSRGMSAYAPVSGSAVNVSPSGTRARPRERRALQAGRARVAGDLVLLGEEARLALDEAALAGLAVGAAVVVDGGAVGLVLRVLRRARRRSRRWPGSSAPIEPSESSCGAAKLSSARCAEPVESGSEKCSAT